MYTDAQDASDSRLLAMVLLAAVEWLSARREAGHEFVRKIRWSLKEHNVIL